MTLDEAIQHCKEKANEQCSSNYNCALEHRQLAVWLSDLKALTKKWIWAFCSHNGQFCA